MRVRTTDRPNINAVVPPWSTFKTFEPHPLSTRRTVFRVDLLMKKIILRSNEIYDFLQAARERMVAEKRRLLANGRILTKEDTRKFMKKYR